MQYARSIALVGAALATVATAVPNHGHAHFHAARAAEAEAEAEAQVVQEGSDGKVFVAAVQTQTAVQTAVQVVTAQAANPAQHTRPAQQQTTVATSVKANSAKPATSVAVSSAKASAAKPATSVASSAKAQPSSGSGGSTSGGSPVVKIINSCDKAIWIGEGNNAMQSLAKGAAPFQTPLAGTSISWKMGFTSDAPWTNAAAEIEFTVTGSNNMTYDLSLQKGNPFMQWGQKLELSDSSCLPIHCQPGVSRCENAYNTEADNNQVGEPSLPCSKASITFTACSG